MVKNKQDETWQVPGVLQEEDTPLNCSNTIKMTGTGQNRIIKFLKVTLCHWTAKSPNGPETIVYQHFNYLSEFPPSSGDNVNPGSQFSMVVPEI